jgi:hypothetical protein
LIALVGLCLFCGALLLPVCFSATFGAPKAKKYPWVFNLEITPPAKRVIVFPRDYSLGEIIISPDATISDEDPRCRSGAAKGTVEVPPGEFVTFIPADRFYKNPSVIKTLAPDSIDCLGMFFSSMADSEDGLGDKAMAYIGHLKGLVKLKLDRSDAQDAAVAHAAELPNLQAISGFQSTFKGKCFKQFAVLKNLRYIHLPSSGIKDENLQYLPAIPHLQFLNLSHCYLSDDGVKYLAGCKELRSLELSDNAKITDKSLKVLLQLRDLRILSLANTSMSNASVVQLKGLPLLHLTLPHNVYQKSEMAAIRKSLPGVIVVGKGSDVRRVDSDTGTLFAPLH